MKKITTFITSALFASMSFAQTADIAQNVSGADIGNNNGAADFEVAFDTAIDQSNISEYRLMVVKDGATFNVDSAANVLAANYMTYPAPLADNVLDTLMVGAADSDGDAIVINTPYQVYVLSVGTNADSLSLASATVTLMDPVSLPFYEDFDATVAPALPTDWSTQTLGTDAGFETTGASPGGFYLMTPYNGNYALTNDDACNCDKSEDYLFLPGPFDLSGVQQYSMSFAYELNNSYDGVAEVQATTDGGNTWFTLDNLPATSTVDGTWTWSIKSVNLSSLNGNSEVSLRFLFNDEGSYAFGLAVDEISIDSLPATDFELTSANVETKYLLTPNSQIRPLDITFEYKNNGADTLFNVDVTADEINTAFSDIFTIAQVLPGESGNATFSTQFWANAGANDYTVNLSSNVTDDAVAGNNMTSTTITVSDSTYSLANSISFFFSDEGRYTNVYEVNQRDTLISIETYLYNGTNAPLTAGDVVHGGLVELDGTGLPVFDLQYTDTFTIPAGVTGTIVPVTLNFPQNLNVEAGSYAVFVSVSENMLGQQDERYETATSFLGNPDANDVYTYLASEDAYGTGTYWFVDALFSSNRDATLTPDSPLPVDGISSDIVGTVSVSPNPANNVVTLNNVEEFTSVAVIDITGKTVMNVTTNSAKAITLNVSELVSGVYIIKASGNNNIATQKLIVE